MVFAMTKKASEPQGKKVEGQRIYGMVSIAVPSDRVTKPVFGRQGFASGALVLDWPAIVGSAVASHTMPIRIRFPGKERGEGTLEIKVASGAFAIELQHLEPLILQRINGYFGWNAVVRLKLRQGPLPQRQPRQPPAPPPAPEASDALLQTLEKVDNPELRAVLERLGRYINAKK